MIFANNIFTVSFIETIGDNMSPSVHNKTSGKNKLIFIAKKSQRSMSCLEQIMCLFLSHHVCFLKVVDRRGMHVYTRCPTNGQRAARSHHLLSILLSSVCSPSLSPLWQSSMCSLSLSSLPLT